MLPPETSHTPSATIPTWRTRATWLDWMLAWSLTSDARHEVHRRHTSVRTVMLVAHADARNADGRTGRNLATSNATVAKELGLKERAVRRARQVIEDIGMAVTVARGRYLTAAERAAARALGSFQIKAASTRYLTLPKQVPCWSPDAKRDPLPVGLRSSYGTSGWKSRTKARKRGRYAKQPQPKPTLAAKRLAAKLTLRAPHLSAGRHLNALARSLDEACLSHWRAGELLDAVDERNAATGLFSLPSTSQRNPIALFVHQAKDATSGKTPPHELARQRAEALRHQQAERERERAEREASCAPPSAAFRAMRAQLAGKAKSWKYQSHPNI